MSSSFRYFCSSTKFVCLSLVLTHIHALCLSFSHSLSFPLCLSHHSVSHSLILSVTLLHSLSHTHILSVTHSFFVSTSLSLCVFPLTLYVNLFLRPSFSLCTHISFCWCIFKLSACFSYTLTLCFSLSVTVLPATLVSFNRLFLSVSMFLCVLVFLVVLNPISH